MRSVKTAKPAAGHSSECALGDPGGIALSAREKLQGSSYSGLKRISCQCRQGVLTLRGAVPTYSMKQLAQAVVSMVDGVEQIVNCVEVVDPSRGSRL